jgi:hypothetical protein
LRSAARILELIVRIAPGKAILFLAA